MKRNGKNEDRGSTKKPPRRRSVATPTAQRVAPLERSSSTVVPTLRADDVRLRHELDVQRTELELQNDELRATRLELEKNLGRYAELFDFAPIGYACLAPGDEIRELNFAGAALLGRPRSRLIGRSFAEFVALRSVHDFRELLIRAHAAESKQTRELELQVGDNPALQARLTAAPMQLDGAIMLAFEDITERKQKEVQLAESERALRESDRRKDDFIAVLSHELRNPLAPIRTGLFVLSQVATDSDEAKNMRGIIDRQVTHLARLINDLLDSTRIRSGKIVLQTERLELADLVRRTVEDHRRGFENRGISIETRITAHELYVSGDSVRLVQVLSNLLGNAEKFTPARGHVVVRLDIEGSRAVLRVTDTGVGIAPSQLDRMFEPFVQEPQTIERARGGLGLGLSMVKGLVELHGGRASIWSEGHNCGTTVLVELPLVERPRAERTKAPEAARRSGLRVLVVDDQRDAADTLANALSFVGHEVAAAYDGPRALQEARTFKPDIVLCDIGLPEMDGYEVARAMRLDPELKQTRLIALSGYARPEDVRLAMKAGFDRHIAKPPDLETLSKAFAEIAPRSV